MDDFWAQASFKEYVFVDKLMEILPLDTEYNNSRFSITSHELDHDYKLQEQLLMLLREAQQYFHECKDKGVLTESDYHYLNNLVQIQTGKTKKPWKDIIVNIIKLRDNYIKISTTKCTIQLKNKKIETTKHLFISSFPLI